MIIKSLHLKNIRSHKNTKINFNEKITLLSGDIGSGKSSFLIALEFALFGFKKGEIDGGTLLKKGASSGDVTLVLFDGKKEITIFREIKYSKKRETINQQNGFINSGGDILDLTPSEINSNLAHLLKSPKAFVSKDKNLIYRYTTYTPQKQLSEILSSDNKTRLEIIRKVFDIDKYEQLRSAIRIYMQEIRNKKTYLNSKIENFEGSLLKLEVLEKEVLEKESELKKHTEKKNLLDYNKEKIKILKKKIEEKTCEMIDKKIKNESQKTKFGEREKQILNLEKKIKNNEFEISEDEKKLKEQVKILKNLSKEDLKKEFFILEKKQKEFLEKTNLKNELVENRSILERTLLKSEQREEKNLEELEKINLNLLEEERIKKSKEIKDLEIENSKFEKQKNEIKKNISKIQEKLSEVILILENYNVLKNQYKKILAGELCPLCAQEVFEEKLEKLKIKFDKLNQKKEIGKKEKLNLELKNLSEKLLLNEENLKTIFEKSQKKILESDSLIKKIKEGKEIKEKISKEKLFSDEFKNLKEKKEKMDLEIKSFNLDFFLEHITKLRNTYNYKKNIFEKNANLEQKIKEQKKLLEEYKLEKENLKKKDFGKYVKEETEKIKKHLENLEEKKELILEKEEENFDKLQKINLRKKLFEDNIKSIYEEIKEIKEDLNIFYEMREKLKNVEKNENFFIKKLDKIATYIEQKKFVSTFLEMGENLEKYFKNLIGNEELEVRLDENFSPILEQDGYDTSIKNLSGGENSSLALAFKLSLKTTIEENFFGSIGLETLLLDEPTQGFSIEQVQVFGELLKSLNIKQIILVSHEEQLKTICDEIISLEKNLGVSRVL